MSIESNKATFEMLKQAANPPIMINANKLLNNLESIYHIDHKGEQLCFVSDVKRVINQLVESRERE